MKKTLLQITEPTSPEPTSSTLAIGIDLGTTNSVVALSRDQKPFVLTYKNGRSLIPSVVRYKNEIPFVGEEEASLEDASGSVIRSIKRLMGRSFQEVDLRRWPQALPEETSSDPSIPSIIRLSIGSKVLTPLEISADILRYLKTYAETQEGRPIHQAVITVPAYFDEGARAATRDAARLAGLQVLRLLNEPTAAALAYGLDQEGTEGIYAVYDLGGGTFDFSLLNLRQGIFQVLATGGDTHLGGDDMDEAILVHFLQERQTQGISSGTYPSAQEWQEGLLKARQVKEALTQEQETLCALNWEGHLSTHRLSREALEILVHPFVERTLKICQSTLTEAQRSQGPFSLQGIVMVGGATRIPYVRQEVERVLGLPPLTTLNPDHTVALGAALQAEALTQGSNYLLLDVTPLSLGIETLGGLTERIIPRHAPIPTTRSCDFTTYQDGQTGMIIHVIQGERDFVKDCRSLGRFELTGIPPLPAGEARVQVTFTVTADGLLTVQAQEKTTGISQKVSVNPSYGLTEEELHRILLESHVMSPQDKTQRQQIEAQVHARQLQKEM